MTVIAWNIVSGWAAITASTILHGRLFSLSRAQDELFITRRGMGRSEAVKTWSTVTAVGLLTYQGVYKPSPEQTRELSLQ
ncbi:hypothetical protein Bpfe_018376 [Biomphalaria pfeifferi]|uniref:Uncharacterized protein n=1 Tax=Biomphalaria pfeifferi TaxID=112525 RepID=A0AAD8F6C9_BIOPF|nr:hypothetical protein Bpfe_018376 [Biomphalaria pfeifferi]